MMQARSRTILRVLLNRYHPVVKESMLQSLPEEDVQPLMALEVPSNDPALCLMAPYEQISRMHYSWLRPAIEQMPLIFQGPVLSIIPEFQAVKLKKWFNVPEKGSMQIAPSLQKYLLNLLQARLEHHYALPLEYLPQTPLSPLAKWEKPLLIELIELLGIHDLASEIRNIIDRERLKKLSPCLTSKQKQYLHICLHHPDKVSSSPFGLNLWDGDCQKLSLLLHRRGMARLGKALCGQHPDFVWHIAHTLDIGRGSILMQNFSYTAASGVTPALVQQITNLMSFLQTKSVP